MSVKTIDVKKELEALEVQVSGFEQRKRVLGISLLSMAIAKKMGRLARGTDDAVAKSCIGISWM